MICCNVDGYFLIGLVLFLELIFIWGPIRKALFGNIINNVNPLSNFPSWYYKEKLWRSFLLFLLMFETFLITSRLVFNLFWFFYFIYMEFVFFLLRISSKPCVILIDRPFVFFSINCLYSVFKNSFLQVTSMNFSIAESYIYFC